MDIIEFAQQHFQGKPYSASDLLDAAPEALLPPNVLVARDRRTYQGAVSCMGRYLAKDPRVSLVGRYLHKALWRSVEP